MSIRDRRRRQNSTIANRCTRCGTTGFGLCLSSRTKYCMARQKSTTRTGQSSCTFMMIQREIRAGSSDIRFVRFQQRVRVLGRVLGGQVRGRRADIVTEWQGVFRGVVGELVAGEGGDKVPVGRCVLWRGEGF
jgi:hypothetical protein